MPAIPEAGATAGRMPAVPGAATWASVWLPFAVVTLIWGGTWIVIRDQLNGVPPQWSVAYRFLLAAGAMALWALVSGAGLRLTGRQIALAAVAGVLQFVLNFNLVYQAERFITSGVVATVFATLIVPNTLLARVFLGQRVTGRFVGGAAVAITGIAMLFIHELRADEGGQAATAAGIALTLGAVLAASGANVIQATPTGRALPLVPFLAWAMGIGAAVNAGVSLAVAGPPVWDPRPGYLLGLVYLALAASAFAFLLYYRIIRVIGPGRSAYSSVLVPVIAMALSTGFEGYRWTGLTIAGAALVIGGLLVALSGRNKPAAAPVPD